MNIIKTLLVFFLFLFMLLFYCYFNYPFWTYINTTNLKLLTEYNGINIKGYRGEQIIINKDFKEYVENIEIENDKFTLFSLMFGDKLNFPEK